MNDNRIIRQMSSVLSVFMVIFYLGAGSFLVFFFKQSYIDEAARMIIGIAFMVYGVFRAFRTYFQIKEAFNSKEIDYDE